MKVRIRTKRGHEFSDDLFSFSPEWQTVDTDRDYSVYPELVVEAREKAAKEEAAEEGDSK